MDPQLLQNVLTPFANSASGWIAPILALGTPIFWMISTLELMCVFTLMVVNHDIATTAEDLVRSVIAIGFTYFLFLNAADWMRNGVIATLIEWGGLVSGFPATNLSPDGVMTLGWTLANTIFGAVGLASTLTMPLTTIVIMLAAVAVFVVFVVAAVVLLKLLIDSYIIAIGCSIFIPIGAFRFTSHVVANYISAVLGVGIQLFFTLVILSIAIGLAQNWIRDLTTSSTIITGDVSVSLKILAESFIFFQLLSKIPTYIAALVVGHVMPGLGAPVSAGGLLRSMASGGGAAAESAGEASSGGGFGSTSSHQVFSRNLQSMLTTT